MYSYYMLSTIQVEGVNSAQIASPQFPQVGSNIFFLYTARFCRNNKGTEQDILMIFEVFCGHLCSMPTYSLPLKATSLHEYYHEVKAYIIRCWRKPSFDWVRDSYKHKAAILVSCFTSQFLPWKRSRLESNALLLNSITRKEYQW